MDVLERWKDIAGERDRTLRGLATVLSKDARFDGLETESIRVYLSRLRNGDAKPWVSSWQRADALADVLQVHRARLPFRYERKGDELPHEEMPELRGFNPKRQAKPFDWFDFGAPKGSGQRRTPWQRLNFGQGHWLTMPPGSGLNFLFHYHDVLGGEVHMLGSLEDLSRNDDGELVRLLGDEEVRIAKRAWLFFDGSVGEDCGWLAQEDVVIVARHAPAPGTWSEENKVLHVRPKEGWRRRFLVDWVARRIRDRKAQFPAREIADALDRVDPDGQFFTTPGAVLLFARQFNKRAQKWSRSWEENLRPALELLLAEHQELNEALLDLTALADSLLRDDTNELWAARSLSALCLKPDQAPRLRTAGALSYAGQDLHKPIDGPVLRLALVLRLHELVSADKPGWRTAARLRLRQPLLRSYLCHCTASRFWRCVEQAPADERAPDDVAAGLMCLDVLSERLDEVGWKPDADRLVEFLYAGMSDDAMPYSWWWNWQQQLTACWRVAASCSPTGSLPCWLFPSSRTSSSAVPVWLDQTLSTYLVPSADPGFIGAHDAVLLPRLLSGAAGVFDHLVGIGSAPLWCLLSAERAVRGLPLDSDTGDDQSVRVLRFFHLQEVGAWMLGEEARWNDSTADSIFNCCFGRDPDLGTHSQHAGLAWQGFRGPLFDALRERVSETAHGRKMSELGPPMSLKDVPAHLHESTIDLVERDFPERLGLLLDGATVKYNASRLAKVRLPREQSRLWDENPKMVLDYLNDAFGQGDNAASWLQRCPSERRGDVLVLVERHGCAHRYRSWLKGLLNTPGADARRAMELWPD